MQDVQVTLDFGWPVRDVNCLQSRRFSISHVKGQKSVDCEDLRSVMRMNWQVLTKDCTGRRSVYPRSACTYELRTMIM